MKNGRKVLLKLWKILQYLVQWKKQYLKTKKSKNNYFLALKLGICITVQFHHYTRCQIIVPSFILVQMMHHINLGQIFWMNYCIWRNSSKKIIPVAWKLFFLRQPFVTTLKKPENKSSISSLKDLDIPHIIHW